MNSSPSLSQPTLPGGTSTPSLCESPHGRGDFEHSFRMLCVHFLCLGMWGHAGLGRVCFLTSEMWLCCWSTAALGPMPGGPGKQGHGSKAQPLGPGSSPEGLGALPSPWKGQPGHPPHPPGHPCTALRAQLSIPVLTSRAGVSSWAWNRVYISH